MVEHYVTNAATSNTRYESAEARSGVRRRRAIQIAVPMALAVLELSHPTWSGGALLAGDAWWVPLHMLLLLGYAALVWLLWVPATSARIVLALFLVCNTIFLGVDGVGVGLLAHTDPAAADQLWNSTGVAVLANLTGATWAASLLCVAAAGWQAVPERAALLGLSGLTWLTFVASPPPLDTPAAISRLAALATGMWLVYTTGRNGVASAVLVFAAILHQHVGTEAALGLLLVGMALPRLPERG